MQPNPMFDNQSSESLHSNPAFVEMFLGEAGSGGYGKVAIHAFFPFNADGSYSIVSLPTCRALKFIPTTYEKTIQREMLASKFIHPCLVRVFQCFQPEPNSFFDNARDNFCIEMELLPGGSVGDLLENVMRYRTLKLIQSSAIDNQYEEPQPVDFTLEQAFIIAYGTIKGIMFLHENHIVHRDIKPENILLDSDMNPRISDFGLAREIDPKKMMTNVGTKPYKAPELQKTDEHLSFNEAVDVYSYGLVLLQIFGQNLDIFRIDGIEIKNENDFYDFVKQGRFKPTMDYQFEDLEDDNETIQNLINDCIRFNPSDRPTSQQVCQRILSIAQNALPPDSRFYAYEQSIRSQQPFPEAGKFAFLLPKLLDGSCLNVCCWRVMALYYLVVATAVGKCKDNQYAHSALGMFKWILHYDTSKAILDNVDAAMNLLELTQEELAAHTDEINRRIQPPIPEDGRTQLSCPISPSNLSTQGMIRDNGGNPIGI